MSILTSKYNSPDVPYVLRKAAKGLGHIACRLTLNGWIAGGALRSRIANDGQSDYDCYFKSSKDLDYAKILIINDLDLKATIAIDDEYLLSMNSKIGKIDLVKKYYYCPKDCLNDFDLTVCCLALDHAGNVYWLDRSLQDIKDKKLVLHNPSTPKSTMLRLVKYGGKGYTMDIENSAKLAKMIKEETDDDTFEKLAKRGNYDSYYEKKKKLESTVIEIDTF